MNTNSDKSEKTSRREFTKAATAALVAIPLIPTALAAQRRVSRTKKKDLHLSAPQGARGFESLLSQRQDPGIEEHIPPMTLTTGSLQVNCHRRLNGTPSGGRWLYQRPNFGNISKVTILVTNELDLGTPFGCWYGPPIYPKPLNAIIKIWFQWNPEGTNRYEPVIDTSLMPPDLIISNPSTDLLQMNINRELTYTEIYHPHRPYKYEHPGYGDRPFRIGAIEVTSTNLHMCRWITRDFDQYRIHVFGNPIDHLRRRRV